MWPLMVAYWVYGIALNDWSPIIIGLVVLSSDLDLVDNLFFYIN